MELSIFKEKDNSRQTINFTGKTVFELLRQLQINSETVLVVRKNEVLTEGELLENQDQIDILSVISGG